jgi:hypothetical protein
MMWGILWAMLAVCMTVMAVGAVELVRDGKPKATIVAPPEGPPAYAAEVLQRYIERMSGARIANCLRWSKSERSEGCHPCQEGSGKT